MPNRTEEKNQKKSPRGEAYAEISRSALARNYQILSRAAEPGMLIPILKADAYGHGAAQCAEILEKEGASLFAVARLSEARTLLPSLRRAHLLILAPIRPEDAKNSLHPRMVVTVNSLEQATLLSCAARRPIRVHLKLDCGMGRLGIPLNRNAPHIVRRILAMPKIKCEAFFTHLPSADDPDEKDTTLAQIARFRDFVKKNAPDIPCHIHASAALLHLGAREEAFARAGLALYGYSPIRAHGAELRPVMRIYAPILQIRTFEKGEPIGYGGTYRPPKKTRIALLGIGYGDGIPRAASGGVVYIRGTSCPIIGRISMDMMTVSLPDSLCPEVGDYAMLFGGEQAPLLRLAEAAGTIPYELLARIAPRIQRILIP